MQVVIYCSWLCDDQLVVISQLAGYILLHVIGCTAGDFNSFDWWLLYLLHVVTPGGYKSIELDMQSNVSE